MFAPAALTEKVAAPSTVLGISGSGWADLAQVVLVFVAMFAIFPTLYGLLRQRKTERERQDLESYNQMADKWSEFLALCLRYPELGTTPLALREGTAMQRPQLLLYSALIQLLNRAYVTYAKASPEIRKERYLSGWENYLIGLLHNKEFREAWDLLNSYYDPKFADYVKELIKGLERTDTPV